MDAILREMIKNDSKNREQYYAHYEKLKNERQQQLKESQERARKIKRDRSM